MKSFKDLSTEKKWEELMCRLARIEDKLGIDELDEPIPERVRDNLRESMGISPKHSEEADDERR